ncbi:MAG: acyloxyacyl hydrolase [Desulforhopalus sp.]|nr:acyloxyacyl hydrolase [Desulforhopalus sp.]
MRVIVLTALTMLVISRPFTANAGEGQLGFGYGQTFRGNTDLRQYELTWRQPLGWKTNLTETIPLSALLEAGAGLIDETGSDESPTFRLALMPMARLEAHANLHLFAGLGFGFMAGETEFTGHNLGGPFFLNSKLGVQIILGKRLSLEYLYYHQSNAGIYDFNASLNIHHLAISWKFFVP